VASGLQELSMPAGRSLATTSTLCHGSPPSLGELHSSVTRAVALQRCLAAKLIIPIDLKQLKATMPTTTPTILDQISAEKAKVSERLARPISAP
jgi:hypothetical protein